MKYGKKRDFTIQVIEICEKQISFQKKSLRLKNKLQKIIASHANHAKLFTLGTIGKAYICMLFETISMD